MKTSPEYTKLESNVNENSLSINDNQQLDRPKLILHNFINANPRKNVPEITLKTKLYINSLLSKITTLEKELKLIKEINN